MGYTPQWLFLQNHPPHFPLQFFAAGGNKGRKGGGGSAQSRLSSPRSPLFAEKKGGVWTFFLFSLRIFFPSFQLIVYLALRAVTLALELADIMRNLGMDHNTEKDLARVVLETGDFCEPFAN